MTILVIDHFLPSVASTLNYYPGQSAVDSVTHVFSFDGNRAPDDLHLDIVEFGKSLERARSEAKIAYREAMRLNAQRADALAQPIPLRAPARIRRWKRRTCGEANRYRVLTA